LVGNSPPTRRQITPVNLVGCADRHLDRCDSRSRYLRFGNLMMTSQISKFGLDLDIRGYPGEEKYSDDGYATLLPPLVYKVRKASRRGGIPGMPGACKNKIRASRAERGTGL
ncbi:MAG: hypothetical protein V1792_17660, partial [Pseudomonadota bacterium]